MFRHTQRFAAFALLLVASAAHGRDWLGISPNWFATDAWDRVKNNFRIWR